jgi:hypothetical protein
MRTAAQTWQPKTVRNASVTPRAASPSAGKPRAQQQTGSREQLRRAHRPRRRVAETIEGVLSADRAAIDNRQDDNFTVNIGQDIPFTGRSYALAFGVPNVLFRVSMAYGIMRHNGVQLGKVDYIAPFLSA